MELSWSTFLLEIINFLVLVWILKRFLYKPVLDVIDRRRASVEKTLADAEDARREADQLKQRYEGRLAEWNREKQQARDELAGNLEAERTRRREELQAELEQERQRAQQAEARRQADEAHRLQQAALQNGARFATALLSEAAGPELENRLTDLAVQQLGDLPDERIATLRADRGDSESPVEVTSVFPIDDDRQQRIREAVARIAGADAPVRFDRDEALVAGLRIAIGDWVLALNVRDELRGFADVTADAADGFREVESATDDSDEVESAAADSAATDSDDAESA